MGAPGVSGARRSLRILHIGRIGSDYKSERERWQRVQFYMNRTGYSPSLSLLSQILQVHVMQCEQWAPTGRNINLHL